MTFDTTPDSPTEAQDRARSLHEHAVNALDIDTYDVIFTAHDNGTVTGVIHPDNIVDDAHYVSNGVTTRGPYQSKARAERRVARWDAETDDDWTIIPGDIVRTDDDIPSPNRSDGPQVNEPVNFREINESLAMILERECPESKDKILDSLDDAIGNNADQLVLW